MSIVPIKRYGSLGSLWPTIYSWLAIVLNKNSCKLVVNIIGCFKKSSLFKSDVDYISAPLNFVSMNH